MNIFVLSAEPRLAARFHLDKHVVKMPLETAQILSTVNHLHGLDAPYKATHANHPCTQWASLKRLNYEWLVELGLELCAEYTYRYGRRHACQPIIEALSWVPSTVSRGSSEWVQAMPDDCKQPQNPVQAYRNYYRLHKQHIAHWTGRDVPDWMQSGNTTV